MPNRLIKETIRTSKSVNKLSDFNFRIWTYLITYVDDYGRGSADPELLKGLVFPRRAGLTEAQISKALDDLANIGMITLYEADGESYFYFPNWDKHQQIRAKKSKFPEPDIACYHLISNDSKCARNPIQSESKEEDDARARGFGKVMDLFLDKVNPLPSPSVTQALSEYADTLGADVVIHALQIAMDERKTSWSYINAILRRYRKDGLTTMDAVLRSEQSRRAKKEAETVQSTRSRTYVPDYEGSSDFFDAN